MAKDELFSGESKNIEYKVVVPDKSEKYMKTVVAFANTQGGRLVIGIDDKTHQGICVIDLDTVMPGLAINDFGDSIRFGASTGAEDEKDLSLIQCDMHLFEVYTKGFIEGCDGKLTDEEIKALPLGAKVMTFECGMRFLTDYLQGDTYFKIKYPEHNLDRCRTQLKLVADMEKKWDTMNEIVSKYNK